MASPVRPLQVPERVGERLRAATVAHRDAQEVAEKCAKRWRALIVEAIDAGMTQADVAALAGVSRARIHHVIVSEHSRA